jgi:hypothetical protein
MKSWLRFAGVGQAAVVLSLTACGAYGAQDISPATAQKLRDYMRPWTSPAPGDPVVLYGFNCSKDPDSRTPPGWIYHLEGGSTTMKPFGTKDARPARYFFWYRAEVRPVFAWERSLADGREWLERQRTERMRPVQAGDGALLDEQELRCLAYRGPLYLDVSLRLYWKLQVLSSEHTWEDALDWSSALRQTWPAPYHGLSGAEAITEEKDAHLSEAPGVLVKLVRDILAGAPLGQAARPDSGQAPGPPLLKLSVAPAALWADGAGRSVIRLEARDGRGRPLEGEFPVECSRGKLSHVKLITDASGVATAHYVAPSEGPGPDSIVVTGPGGCRCGRSCFRRTAFRAVISRYAEAPSRDGKPRPQRAAGAILLMSSPARGRQALRRRIRPARLAMPAPRATRLPGSGISVPVTVTSSNRQCPELSMVLVESAGR